MKQLAFSLIVISLFILSSCLWPKNDANIKPAELVLPPETQEGKGIFACKINGKVYIDERPLNFINYNPYSNSSVMSLGATFKEKINNKINENDILIFLRVPEGKILKQDTTYLLEYRPAIDTIGSGGYYINNQSCKYYTNPTLKSSLTITKIDLSNHFVSGRFNMLLTNGSCNSTDTVRITEGIIDMKFVY